MSPLNVIKTPEVFVITPHLERDGSTTYDIQTQPELVTIQCDALSYLTVWPIFHGRQCCLEATEVGQFLGGN